MHLLRHTLAALLGACLLASALAAPADADLMIFAFASWAKAAEPPAPAEAPPDMPARTRAELREINRRLDQGYGNMSRGRYQEALSQFRSVLKFDPASHRARFGLGNVMIQLQQFEEARTIFEALVADYPEDYSLKNNLAWLYATARDHHIRNGARALELAQDALLLAPTDFHVWSTLSEAYYILGQYARAQRAAQIALDLASTQRGTERNIEEYRRQANKCRRAAEAMSIIE
ncbi:MAG: tetratricopeptide repeat protein [Verrucomicrobia bacterium]|nr:tetratricopeptide repeat protein [Verrucomicrobiota bacterium]